MDGGTVTERVSAETKLPTDLTGKGVLIAIIDSGIDYLHPDFQNPDGTSRILYLWDQGRDIVYTKEEINEALSAYREGSGGRNRAAALQIVPSADTSGHGTAVAAIAAGNGRGSSGLYRGVACESELMVVKLGIPLADNFPRTTQLMEAVDFVLRTARQLGRPVAVNLSFGNTYGSHDGTSLLETFLDDMTGYGRNVIVAGTGNEGAGAGHTGGLLEMGREQVIELSVSAFENSFGPWGVYHPSADLHHIKKENIGLIEVMGLAVLPARLKKEMALLEQYILEKQDVRSNPQIEKHADWVDSWLGSYEITEDNIHAILQKEIGKVFVQVLECAGVYKNTKKGRIDFGRFIETL